MKNLIIKTNKWFDSLSEVLSLVVFLSLVYTPFTILMLSINGRSGTISAMIWILILIIWRLSYNLLKTNKK